MMTVTVFGIDDYLFVSVPPFDFSLNFIMLYHFLLHDLIDYFINFLYPFLCCITSLSLLQSLLVSCNSPIFVLIFNYWNGLSGCQTSPLHLFTEIIYIDDFQLPY